MGRHAAVETASNREMRADDAIQVRSRRRLLPRQPVTGRRCRGDHRSWHQFFNVRLVENADLSETPVRANPGWVGAVHYQDCERVNHDIRLVDGKSWLIEYTWRLHPHSRR